MTPAWFCEMLYDAHFANLSEKDNVMESGCGMGACLAAIPPHVPAFCIEVDPKLAPISTAVGVLGMPGMTAYTGLLEIGKPQPFPVNAVLEMRCCLAADEEGKLVDFARAAFKAYWGDLKDVSQPAVIADVCRVAGLNPDAILARATAQDIKDRLRANTEEVIARGGFGSPTMFVNTDDMYFGNDRLPLVEAALMRAQ